MAGTMMQPRRVMARAHACPFPAAGKDASATQYRPRLSGAHVKRLMSRTPAY